MNTLIDRARIDEIIANSGLFGLTVYTNPNNTNTLEFYYYGNPTDSQSVTDFTTNARKAINDLAGSITDNRKSVTRSWFYANEATHQSGVTIPYASITSDLHTSEKSRPNQVTQAVAQSLNPTARGFEQQNITSEQRELQTRVANAYDNAPLYDLDNPLVRRAYEELAVEVKEQFNAMPIKHIELLTGQGEPYANSAEMREDVRINNRLKVFATTPDSFGSNPNIDYSTHPLMQASGLRDVNGKPLLMNDLFRAVHDYYAHTMSPVAFGPKGEEAAWKNHSY
ncbi:hypothetical protein [Acinetobacter sp. c1-l78]|uniref:hypothetical protein n=1 Tax=Acinetobacter sp. c1-l78 TaxID=3342803 RepID=UPI0035B6AF57